MVAAVIGTGLALSAMGKAIVALYGISKNINDFMDEHIDSMKKSDNVSISRVGSVLEGAKFGFGLGYLTSMIVMAGGQLLLGNTLAAISTVTAVTNPVAMTCAAVGAIYFGWTALNEAERDAIVQKLIAGFEVGSELIRAIFNSIVEKFKAFANSEWLKDLRKIVGEAAGHFGRKFSDISGKVKDKVYDYWDAAKAGSEKLFFEGWDTAVLVLDGARDLTSDVTKRAGEMSENVVKSAQELVKKPNQSVKSSAAAKSQKSE